MSKSVLDNIPVEEKGFPLSSKAKDDVKIEVKPDHLYVNGHCPQCGAAIFGPTMIRPGEQPKVTYSCNCWRKQGGIEQRMETK